jgi:hypothetical protein
MRPVFDAPRVFLIAGLATLALGGSAQAQSAKDCGAAALLERLNGGADSSVLAAACGLDPALAERTSLIRLTHVQLDRLAGALLPIEVPMGAGAGRAGSGSKVSIVEWQRCGSGDSKVRLLALIEAGGASGDQPRKRRLKRSDCGGPLGDVVARLASGSAAAESLVATAELRWQPWELLLRLDELMPVSSDLALTLEFDWEHRIPTARYALKIGDASVPLHAAFRFGGERTDVTLLRSDDVPADLNATQLEALTVLRGAVFGGTGSRSEPGTQLRVSRSAFDRSLADVFASGETLRISTGLDWPSKVEISKLQIAGLSRDRAKLVGELRDDRGDSYKMKARLQGEDLAIARIEMKPLGLSRCPSDFSSKALECLGINTARTAGAGMVGEALTQQYTGKPARELADDSTLRVDLGGKRPDLHVRMRAISSEPDSVLGLADLSLGSN